MVTTLKKLLCFMFLFVFLNISVSNAQDVKEVDWTNLLLKNVEDIDKSFNGEFGIYIEDLKSKKKFSFNAGQRYYLASVVKLFVMAEIYRLVYEGKLQWQDRIRIAKSKYRDAGFLVNQLKIGQTISIRHLMNHMMQKSDNAATDILIEVAGLSNVDDAARRYGVFDLGVLTSMLDIRKIVFRELHPLAGNLTSNDYYNLWKVRPFEPKLKKFASLIGKPKRKFYPEELSLSFEKFFATGANSASLIGLSEFLKNLAYGEIVNPEASKEMIELLKTCKTGLSRIKKGLPPDWKWAHKTGTQYKRMCDAGIAYSPENNSYVIIVCLGKFDTRPAAENIIAKISRDFITAIKTKPQEPKLPEEPEPPPIEIPEVSKNNGVKNN